MGNEREIGREVRAGPRDAREFPPRVWADFNCAHLDEHTDMARLVSELRAQGVEPCDGLEVFLVDGELQAPARLRRTPDGAWRLHEIGGTEYPRIRLPLARATTGPPFPLDDPATVEDLARERFRLSDGITVPLSSDGWWMLAKARRRPEGTWVATEPDTEWWNEEPGPAFPADVAGVATTLELDPPEIRQQLEASGLELLEGARLWISAGPRRAGGLVRRRPDGTWWLELDRGWLPQG